MTGYVYFIRCQDRVKIGFSKDPRKRLTKINADAPFPCDLMGYADAKVHPEKLIHARFANIRVHSEWFLIDRELLDFIGKVSIHDPVPAGDKFARADLSKLTSIKAWRYRNRMTLVEAAAHLGVTQGFLSRVETGRYKFSPDRLPDVSRITGIPPHELRPDLAGIFFPRPPTPRDGHHE